MKALLALVICSALAGCATTSISPSARAAPQQEDMRECAPLSPFEGETAVELLGMIAPWGAEHLECARHHKNLIDWIRAGQK